MFATSLCALVLAAASAEPIRVGVYASFTGMTAPSGTSLRNGLRLAAEEINAAGGVLGRKIELVERDDGGVPDRGVAAVTELIEREHVGFLFGPSYTAVADATTHIANEREIPLIVAAATGSTVDGLFVRSPENYVFRLALPDAAQAASVVREVVDVLRARRPAVFYADDPFGRSGQAKLATGFERRGVAPVYVRAFKGKSPELPSWIAEARKAKPDAVVIYAVSADQAAFVLAAAAAGWKPPAVVGPWGISQSAFLKQAGAAGEGAITVTCFIEEEAGTPAAQRFVDLYRRTFNERPMSAASAAAQGYDALHLLALAIQQARTTDASRVKTALENLRTRYVGALGEFEKPWSPTEHEAIRTGRVGVVRDGKIVAASR
ncbi:ABC transporter substrate-binding protein [Anaeromyxobacter diazotrophicus]|uniref:ABC transporter substrate-binding protein n=1 Tax=Anaeromyxobacter diazotrophicus TaxID=2590199 RepID=A0A7I9VGH3_9BACT|nr:ABC transporter substrate-binding protein [Anaeromyxobacter diazotrophicus]GEJ55492.1 ABC transporter substrate-binding protein [Anaeromyxobacter diazotrophicus]